MSKFVVVIIVCLIASNAVNFIARQKLKADYEEIKTKNEILEAKVTLGELQVNNCNLLLDKQNDFIKQIELDSKQKEQELKIELDDIIKKYNKELKNIKTVTVIKELPQKECNETLQKINELQAVFFDEIN